MWLFALGLAGLAAALIDDNASTVNVKPRRQEGEPPRPRSGPPEGSDLAPVDVAGEAPLSQTDHDQWAAAVAGLTAIDASETSSGAEQAPGSAEGRTAHTRRKMRAGWRRAKRWLVRGVQVAREFAVRAWSWAVAWMRAHPEEAKRLVGRALQRLQHRMPRWLASVFADAQQLGLLLV